MKKLRSYMFEGSAKSLDESGVIWKSVKFVFVFAVIIILEAIIPAILAFGPMMDEYKQIGVLTGEHEVSVAESILISTRIATMPRVMIPSLFATVFGTITSIVYVRGFEIRRASTMGAVREKAVPHYIVGILVGVGLISAIDLLSVAFGANSLSVGKDINFGLITLYLLGFLVQGMSEEFIFRGYLLTSIGGKAPASVAIAISSVGFMLAHAMNPGFGIMPIINLTMFGVFAALYMLYTGDIWGVCAIHSFWNFTQGSIWGISVSGSGSAESVIYTTAESSHGFLTGGKFGIEGSIFTTVVLAAGIAVLVVLTQKKAAREEK